MDGSRYEKNHDKTTDISMDAENKMRVILNSDNGRVITIIPGSP